MTAPLRLHYAPDNASLIVRLVLEELRLDHTTVLVNRAARQHKDAAYLRLNPNGLIPVLETPHGAIFETAAILLWLADRHGALAPAPDAADRGDFLKWLFFLSNTLHSDLRIIFHPALYAGADPAAQAALRDGVQARLSAHLAILEAADWPSAPAPDLRHFYAATCLRWMALYPGGAASDWFDLRRYPGLRDMAARLETRDCVRAAVRAEGLGPSPFTAPVPPNPPEGSPT